MGKQNFDYSNTDYVDVAARLVEFRAKYPDGTLQPADPKNPYRIETIGEATFVVYTAAAYRTPDDPRPGIGIAWEPFPGRTPYTRNSELQNAETSAWGRAVIAVGAADSKRGIASAEEVRNRQAERDQPNWSPPAEPVTDWEWSNSFESRVAAVTTQDALKALFREMDEKHGRGQITDEDRATFVRLVTLRKSELEGSPA